MAFAGLGAAEILTSLPGDESATRLARAVAEVLDRDEVSTEWRWPEARLAYANGALAEALIAVGSTLGDQRLMRNGVRQLKWLLAKETSRGHLSVTPVGGRGPYSAKQGFDQQPIEVAALSDACVRAFDVTGDSTWLDGVELATAWFMGDNDRGVVMFDAATHGGYDGLCAHGANLNQGAESTIALLTVLQNARILTSVSP
jgi:uncharacterized protein YyaL (SSP411 family)